MSRSLRSHLPRAVFHITARTHRKEPWFQDAGLRSAVAAIIREGATSSDALLLAFVVMSNHFHLVLQQGQRPLGWVMQPIMRRTALLLQREVGFKGYAFERRYRSAFCDSPVYLRRSIVYTHINPQRAGMCAYGQEYPWTSHKSYIANVDVAVAPFEIAYVLPLFASAPNRGLKDLQADYLRHVEWRLEKDAHDEAGLPYDVPEPAAPIGDAYFIDHFMSGGFSSNPPLKDLRDRAIELLQLIEPHAKIDDLRRSYGPRHATQLRNQVIAGLLQSGYRGKCIAAYMRVSDATVSAIAVQMRYAKS